MQVKHILDEPLLEAIRLRGRVASEDGERSLSQPSQAERIGARALPVTCSTISPLVDQIQTRVSIPIFKIYQAMIERAVQLGPRVGEIATNRTTLVPTRGWCCRPSQRSGPR